MIIGIMSDTHDNLDNLRKAVDIFTARDVRHVLHAGDFTSPFTAKVLKPYLEKFTGIFGNNDGDKIFLRKMFLDRIFPQPHILNLGGRGIVIMHEPDVVDAVAASGQFDLVVYGHLHEAVIRAVGATVVVNPGEVGGWLYGKPSVVVMDLATLVGEIILL